MMLKSNLQSKIFDILNYVLLSVFVAICIYPFYYVFIYSISVPGIADAGIVLLPAGFTLRNYAEVLKFPGIFDSLIISVLRTVLGTLLSAICCSFFAYIVTKNQLPGRKIIYRFLVITMYFDAGLIPVYLVYSAYGLKNNFLVYILPHTLVAFYVVLVKTYIEQLPPSLEESANMDGAGYFRIFSSIIFPLSMPIIATVMVFEAVYQWNSWFDNFIYTESAKSLRTLQLVLYDFLQEARRISEQLKEGDITAEKAEGIYALTPSSVRMTITMVITLPILFVYPSMQKYFVKGLMLGAIKG